MLLFRQSSVLHSTFSVLTTVRTPLSPLFLFAFILFTFHLPPYVTSVLSSFTYTAHNRVKLLPRSQLSLLLPPSVPPSLMANVSRGTECSSRYQTGILKGRAPVVWSISLHFDDQSWLDRNGSPSLHITSPYPEQDIQDTTNF